MQAWSLTILKSADVKKVCKLVKSPAEDLCRSLSRSNWTEFEVVDLYERTKDKTPMEKNLGAGRDLNPPMT